MSDVLREKVSLHLYILALNPYQVLFKALESFWLNATNEVNKMVNAVNTKMFTEIEGIKGIAVCS